MPFIELNKNESLTSQNSLLYIGRACRPICSRPTILFTLIFEAQKLNELELKTSRNEKLSNFGSDTYGPNGLLEDHMIKAGKTTNDTMEFAHLLLKLESHGRCAKLLNDCPEHI